MEIWHEAFPILSGVILGMLIGAIRPGLRLWIGIPLAVVLGVTATVISGEYQISWEFLLIDIPLVSLAAVAVLVVTRRVVRRIIADRA